MTMISQVSLAKFGAIQVIEGCLCSMSMVIWDIDNAAMIPQVSLPKFGAIQDIEECLCSMSMEVWDIDNATLVKSITRLLVHVRRVQSL